VAQTTNIIELNGKRYDAKTGMMLGNGQADVTRGSVVTHARQGRAIDDFIHPDHRAVQAHIAKQHIAKTTSPVPSQSQPAQGRADITPVKKVRSGQAMIKPIAAHQPQKSKILMRHAVQKPTFKLKTAIKTQAPAEVMAKPLGVIVPKASAYQLNPARVHRAKAVSRSPHVGRFAPAKAAEPRVAVAPPATRAHANLKPGQSTRATAQHMDSFVPRHAATRHTANTRQAHHAAPKQAIPTDIFEAAIAHTTSHERPAPKVKRRSSYRWFKIGASVVIFFALTGTVLWMNRTNIALHFASARAGFSVAMPSYVPTGYVLNGGVQAANGKVTLSFRSGSAEYSLTQQASPWDSNTLRDNMLALTTGAPRTLTAAGRTVYLYGDGNATWVDGGVRYNLATNNNLSSSEITKLAASI